MRNAVFCIILFIELTIVDLNSVLSFKRIIRCLPSYDIVLTYVYTGLSRIIARFSDKEDNYYDDIGGVDNDDDDDNDNDNNEDFDGEDDNDNYDDFDDDGDNDNNEDFDDDDDNDNNDGDASDCDSAFRVDNNNNGVTDDSDGNCDIDEYPRLYQLVSKGPYTTLLLLLKRLISHWHIILPTRGLIYFHPTKKS